MLTRVPISESMSVRIFPRAGGQRRPVSLRLRARRWLDVEYSDGDFDVRSVDFGPVEGPTRESPAPEGHAVLVTFLSSLYPLTVRLADAGPAVQLEAPPDAFAFESRPARHREHEPVVPPEGGAFTNILRRKRERAAAGGQPVSRAG